MTRGKKSIVTRMREMRRAQRREGQRIFCCFVFGWIALIVFMIQTTIGG